MTRLESMIRRLRAQRDCLNLAVSLTKEMHGTVLELGLGNGRTFDHIRSIAPDRDIYVFEIVISKGLKINGEIENLILGDVRETLPQHIKKHPGEALFVHNDIGSGTEKEAIDISRWLSPLIIEASAPGCVAASHQALELPGWRKVTLPEPHTEKRYFMYQRPAG